jgi:hypothetical protein
MQLFSTAPELHAVGGSLERLRRSQDDIIVLVIISGTTQHSTPENN